MKQSFWIGLSSVCAIAAITAGASPGRSENVCYMVDANGREINLNQLCQRGDTSALRQPSLETEATNESAADSTEAPEPTVRRYTIIRELGPAEEVPAGDAESTGDAEPSTVPTGAAVPDAEAGLDDSNSSLDATSDSAADPASPDEVPEVTGDSPVVPASASEDDSLDSSDEEIMN
ncbi:hypothetical protein [Sphaerothrix gracilis]|uniref:hypothetical protein n=1 Tax=Sphaerothrix gracilis TaxID=3151835 RepID=UPI0031FE0177